MIQYLIMAIILTSFSYTSESIALVMKKKGFVQHKKFNSDIFNTSIYRNKSLYNDDIIRTGSDGYTKVVYLDDGSTIKLHKDSQVFIQGDIEERKIVKKITILTGKIKLDVIAGSKNEFKIITPTSVASIKGTRFWVDVQGEVGDQFLGLEGVVNISNNFSNKAIQLIPGNTVISLSDGTLINEPTKSLLLQKLEKLEIDVGESNEDMPTIEIPSNFEFENETSDFKYLIIKVSNDNSDEKELIIKYTD